MKQNTTRIFLPLLAACVLLAACGPSGSATQDPAEVQRIINESVALTVAAQNAKATEQQSLLPQPSNTPLATQTEAVAAAVDLPTATPFVVIPPTTVSSSGGAPYVAPPKPEYACDCILQKPADFSYWKRNKDFDVRWTIVNTGTKAWQAGLDLTFHSGTNFAKSSFVELPYMAPGDTYTVILDAVTPSSDGQYIMVWKLEGGFCFPAIGIIVEQ